MNTVHCPCCGRDMGVPRRDLSKKTLEARQIELINQWSRSGVSDKVIGRALGMSPRSVAQARQRHGHFSKYRSGTKISHPDIRAAVSKLDAAVLCALPLDKPVRRTVLHSRLPVGIPVEQVKNSLIRLRASGAIEMSGQPKHAYYRRARAPHDVLLAMVGEGR